MQFVVNVEKHSPFDVDVVNWHANYFAISNAVENVGIAHTSHERVNTAGKSSHVLNLLNKRDSVRGHVTVNMKRRAQNQEQSVTLVNMCRTKQDLFTLIPALNYVG